MARESSEQALILNKLLELSILQRSFIKENKIDELLEAQVLREGLFSMLQRAPSPVSEELTRLARELSESDAELSSSVSSVKESIAARLGQVKTGMSALKAYGRY